MSAPPPQAVDASAVPSGGRKSGKKKLILFGAPPVLLIAIGAGLWFSGIGPRLLGRAKPPPPGMAVAAAPAAPVFADLPEIIANLNAPLHHPSFIKLKAKLELARTQDQAALATGMPRVLDLFQTYLREMRPEELRGAAGTYRLREELIARADIAIAPAEVTDVLFTEMLIQ